MRKNHESNQEAQGLWIFQKQNSQAKGAGWTWQLVGAVLGFTSGTATLIFGEVFTVIAWLVKPEGPGASLRRFGTALCLLTIPLLGFGAHCLDLLDKKLHPHSSTTNSPPGYAAPASRPLNKKQDGHLFAIIGVLNTLVLLFAHTSINGGI
jgi:hypothetical protein